MEGEGDLESAESDRDRETDRSGGDFGRRAIEGRRLGLWYIVDVSTVLLVGYEGRVGVEGEDNFPRYEVLTFLEDEARTRVGGEGTRR